MNSELQNLLALLASQADTKTLPIAERRRIDDETGDQFPLPDGLHVEPVVTADFKGEWVKAVNARDDAVLLYFHGGAYVFCSPRSHRHLVAALSEATGFAAFALDYRLAPEHPFPAAIEDSVAAYRWLLEQGFASNRIAIAGDSAGGGLTIATMLKLREAGLPLPAAGVCLSPWVDLTMAGASYSDSAEAIATRDRLAGYVKLFLNDSADVRNPLVSPVFADLKGLPPLLIQVGAAEPFYDDSISLEATAKASGVETTLEIWPEMIHVWHYFYPMLTEGREAIARIGEFVKAQTA
ncbi:MAG: alpha/beta hydrolase [Acidobacteriota bacterium]|nr:alpha/beta hydrolase [Acidobacteriota bacterium]